jgi:penicillin-binding protein 1A
MIRFIIKGFNINTPINLEFQKIATESLRNGLITFDKRKGWRGPLTNKEIFKKLECRFRKI